MRSRHGFIYGGLQWVHDDSSMVVLLSRDVHLLSHAVVDKGCKS